MLTTRTANSGEHSAIFDNFGEPREYWVRSTRERPDRIYPTKPVVGFVRNKPVLSGGWANKEHAAAQLHNAGFIIVDSEGTAVIPPKQYDYLIRDADRIRLCALNYHIETARESGAREVSIYAGSLAKDMGLLNAFPAICSALGSAKLQELAKVPPPTHTEPNPSSSTIFTFRLAANDERKIMRAASSEPMPSATNVIFTALPAPERHMQQHGKRCDSALGLRPRLRCGTTARR